ncbi:MAG: DUF2007 domain-containing protein [Fimbriimonadaceae bacterium]|nr:DUF2007 domain-containing protein [Chitinophagales bacterium]
MAEDKIIILASYHNSAEANIARGVLEQHEILCFLSNENYSELNPFFNILTGGIKLHVFEKDKEIAEMILSLPPIKDENNSEV